MSIHKGAAYAFQGQCPLPQSYLCALVDGHISSGLMEIDTCTVLHIFCVYWHCFYLLKSPMLRGLRGP